MVFVKVRMWIIFLQFVVRDYVDSTKRNNSIDGCLLLSYLYCWVRCNDMVVRASCLYLSYVAALHHGFFFVY